MVAFFSRVFFITSGVLLSFGSVQAANPAHQWSQRFGWVEFDAGQGLAVDASGNVIVTGAFWGHADFGGGDLVAPSLADDIFLAKYDKDGVHQWSRNFGGTGTDQGFAVAVDGSGNVIVTGWFQGTVDFGGGGVASAGSFDAFVAKYDESGVYQWSRHFGDTSGDAGQSVAVDAWGSVIVTGFFAGTVDFGGGNLVSAGDADIFVAKYDAGGAHLWSRRFGGSSFDPGRAVAVDASGNLIVTGGFTGTVDFGGGDLIGEGFNDIFVAKYDADGVHEWSRRFGNPSFNQGLAVAVDASGNAAVAGRFEGTVDFGGGNLVSAGSADIFLARYDAGGVHEWSRRFGGANNDVGESVAMDPSGNLVVTGSFQKTVDFGGGNLVSAGTADIFLVKYSKSGVHRWSRRFGGNSFDVGEAVAVDGSGNVMMTGYFNGTVDFGGGNLVSEDFADIFVAKYSQVGSRRHRKQPYRFEDWPQPALASRTGPSRFAALYQNHPNPFNPSTVITFSLPAAMHADLSVFDSRGSLVKTLVDRTLSAGEKAYAWDGTDIGGTPVSSGVYFYRLRTREQTLTKKMILLK